MEILYQTLRQNRLYYLGYAFFVAILASYCIIFPKAEGFLMVNQYHCPFFDYFFILFTNLGDGLFTVAIMIFFMIRRKFAWTIQLAVSFLLTGAVVQIVKRIVHEGRPQMVFGPQTMHFIHGITRTGFGSFPSGHTATIFALTTLLAIFFPARKFVVIFLLLAVLTGFSRIYLSQHFPVDVLAGSFIGVVISTISFVYISQVSRHKKWNKKETVPESVKLR